MATERLEARIELDTRDASVAVKDLAKDVGFFTVGLQEAVNAGKRLVGAVVDFGKESLKAFQEQEEAERRLEAILRATGGTAGYTAGQLKAMAANLQNVTTFGDEAVLSAQSILLTYKEISAEVFPKTLDLALDLSSAFGVDLSTAARTLGKALSDPAGSLDSLRRVGVVFTQSQEEMIKKFVATNDAAGAQKLMLTELESRIGGVAKEMAATSSGAMKQFANAWGDLKEIVGGFIAEALTPALQKLTEFVKLIASAGNATKLSSDAMKMSEVELRKQSTDQLRAYIDALKQMIDLKQRDMELVPENAAGLQKEIDLYERQLATMQKIIRQRGGGSVAAAPVAQTSAATAPVVRDEEIYAPMLARLRSMLLEIQPTPLFAINLAMTEFEKTVEQTNKDLSYYIALGWEMDETTKAQMRALDDYKKQLSTIDQLYKQLREGMINIAATGFVDQMRELGASAYDAGMSLNTLGSALASLGLQIINMLPQLFLQAGLQQILAGNVGLGLALIAMAGVTAATGGYVTAATREESSHAIVPRTAPTTVGSTVNVINNAAAEVKTEQRTLPDGSAVIDVIIGSVGSRIANGDFDNILQSRFGIRPKGVVR